MILATLLIVAGLALVLAEVFFPSLGLLGLLAGGCILAGTVIFFEEAGSTLGFVLIGVEIVLIPLLIRQAFRWLPRLPFGRRMLLEGPATPPGAGVEALDRLVGQEGIAATDLRPGGIGRFGEERISVVARTGTISKGTPIIVLGVEGPEVRVAPAPGAAPDGRNP